MTAPSGDCSRAHRGGVRDVKLDADLRHRPLRRPLRRPEARLGSLRQRPDTERLTTGDLLAVVIVATMARQRQAKRIDIESPTGGRIWRDHRDGREELDVHFSGHGFGTGLSGPSARQSAYACSGSSVSFDTDAPYFAAASLTV
jgi:hypothetical protein